MYEVQVGHHKTRVTIGELLSFTRKLIDDQNFNTSNATDEDMLFSICSSALAKHNTVVYKLFDSYKIKQVFTLATAGSLEDNDQVMRQKGFRDGDTVSHFELYVDDTLVAIYGSRIYGEQKVYVYYDENRQLVPIDEGKECRIYDQPEDMVRAMVLQREQQKEYLDFTNNCWLQPYFETTNGIKLTDYSQDLNAELEYIHGSIAEYIIPEKQTVEEIVTLAKK